MADLPVGMCELMYVHVFPGANWKESHDCYIIAVYGDVCDMPVMHYKV